MGGTEDATDTELELCLVGIAQCGDGLEAVDALETCPGAGLLDDGALCTKVAQGKWGLESGELMVRGLPEKDGREALRRATLPGDVYPEFIVAVSGCSTPYRSLSRPVAKRRE